MTIPDDKQDPDVAPVQTPLSRRSFLRMTGLAGLGVALGGLGLTGCDDAPALRKSAPPDRDLAVGPEPSSRRAPTPLTPPPEESPSLELKTDVCVVGGGAAGMCAATVAARMGVKVTLLEESFVLGGNVTRGLVSLDLPGWGAGPMVAGWFTELIQSLAEQGDAIFPDQKETGLVTPYNVDALRAKALSLALEAGVDVRLGTRVVWAEVAQYSVPAPPGEATTDLPDAGLPGAAGAGAAGATILSLSARDETTLLHVEAPVFIDCTGDGNLGYLAGSRYWLGDRYTGALQGQTLIFFAAPVDLDQLWAYARSEGSQVEDYRIIGMRHLMEELHNRGVLDERAQGGMLINRHLWPGMVSISASETYGNHLEPGEVAGIVSTLEEQNRLIHAALRERVPGFADSGIVRTAERPYLREGRRLVGHCQLSAADIKKALKPGDSIARGYYPVDLHRAGKGGIDQTVYLDNGDWYGIPYHCLVAKDLDNMLMAGRCISVTHEALGSTRISPVSMALGQAAGVAAALCARGGVRPADLSPTPVQTELQQQGALI